MISTTNQLRQLAAEQHLGSLVGTYRYPGFGKYLAAASAVCLLVFIVFASSGALHEGQGWFCLTLLAAGPTFICILAYRARDWGIYEYDEGFIVNQGRDLRIVGWDEIVTLERSTSVTTVLNPTGDMMTYTLWLKYGLSVMLTTNYRGIAHLITTIEGKLAEAKYQGYSALGLTSDSSPVFSAA